MTRLSMIYDFILDNSNEEEAKHFATGLVWNEAEAVQTDLPKYHRYIETIDGVGIWYDFGADSYFFTDETDEV